MHVVYTIPTVPLKTHPENIENKVHRLALCDETYLHPLSPCDSHTDVGLVDHADIVGPVPHCQSHLTQLLLHQHHHGRLWGRGEGGRRGGEEGRGMGRREQGNLVILVDCEGGRQGTVIIATTCGSQKSVLYMEVDSLGKQ